MNDLLHRRRFVVAVVVVVAGLFLAAFGAVQSERGLLWAGLLLAGVGFVLGRPPDSEAALDERAAEFESD